MEFRCPDPEAVVRAANVRATLDAFKLVPSIGRRIIERHALHVDDLLPDHFVRVQLWLDALKDIQSAVGVAVVRDVGARIIANADFPPQYASASEILLALDEIFYLNHKGDVGHYRTSRAPDGAITVRCETPYPRHFEWGLIEGITRNERVKDRIYGIEYIDGPPAGDLTCTLIVRPLR